MRLIFGILLTVFPALSLAADSVTRNRDGTEAFRNGNFEQAAEAFADAEQAAPDDLRIVFNRGAALSAAGRFDEAIDALQKSALSRNPDLAAKSSALLGEIAVARVKNLSDSEPEKHDDILGLLQTAERHYMDSRLARPERPESAAALEQIRSWRQRVETEWAEADRAGKRQSDLPDRLHWLENWQQEIGGTIARELDEPDSPKKFQEFFEAAKDQNSLSHEIGLLQHEFRQQLEKTSDTEERPLLEAGLEELDRLRDDSGAVGQNLHALRGKEALGGVDSLLQRLHRLRINLSPCEVIVREAERKQAMLCELNSGAEISDADSSQQALEQQKVADWMPLAVSRAEQWLEKEKQGAFSTSGEAGEAEQFEAYKETMRRAVQYGPEIQTQAEEASRHLLDQAFDEARPQQQQALELLRKILEPLQNQQDQDQQNQDQQGQQGQQQNQGGKGEQKPSQQSQEQDQKDREKQAREDQPSPKQDPDDAEKDDKEHREPKSGDQDEEREKAESKLRQVKRRQQEAQEKRERIRALLMQLEPVDKDW